MSMAGVPALFTLLGFIGKRRYIAAVLGPPPVFVFAFLFLFFFYFRQWSPTMGLVPAVIFVPWSLLFAGFAWEPRLRNARRAKEEPGAFNSSYSSSLAGSALKNSSGRSYSSGERERESITASAASSALRSARRG